MINNLSISDKIEHLAEQYITDGKAKDYTEARSIIQIKHPELWKSYLSILSRFFNQWAEPFQSVLVPVTEIDGEFTPTKQADLAGVLEAMPADFGGNVDK